MTRFRRPIWLLSSLLAALMLLPLLFAKLFADDQSLRPFSSDGCSRFPDGTLAQQNLWLDCCIAHDKAYWLGGTRAERQAADIGLQQCVATVGEPEIARLMLAGVTVGGSPYWFTPFRWGYGWSYWDGWLPRGYKALTDAEKARAKALLESWAATTQNSGNATIVP